MYIASFAMVGLKVVSDWGYQGIMLLYLGPETVMPLASILGVVVGFLLIFWRLLLKPFKKIARFGRDQGSEPSPRDASSTELYNDTQEETS
jgi:hypothetical protein